MKKKYKSQTLFTLFANFEPRPDFHQPIPIPKLVMRSNTAIFRRLISYSAGSSSAAATAPKFAPATATSDKSALAKLRKSTGYSFSRCKEALQKHQNDIQAAEKWLRLEAQTHGWEKATKLQGRATAQGLVSVLASPSNAVILELNCETDFVARNKKFQALVQKVTNAAYNSPTSSSSQSDSLFKLPLNDSELGQLKLGSHSAADEIALAIGDIGENIKSRRGLLLRASAPIFLSGYTHPAPSPEASTEAIQLGKFGVLLAYKRLDAHSGDAKLAEAARQLCQHIVGMNPLEIGSMEETPKPKIDHEIQESKPVSTESTDGDADVEIGHVGGASAEDETKLLDQEFLLEPEFSVREFVASNGIEILDFVRFEVGECL